MKGTAYFRTLTLISSCPAAELLRFTVVFITLFTVGGLLCFRWEQIYSITSSVNQQEWMVLVCGRHGTHYVLYRSDTDNQVGQVLSTIAKTPCVSLFVTGLCGFLTCCLGFTQEGKGSTVDFKHYEHVLNIIIFGIEKKPKHTKAAKMCWKLIEELCAYGKQLDRAQNKVALIKKKKRTSDRKEIEGGGKVKLHELACNTITW